MVLPRLVDAALAGRPLVVHDDGRQERSFAHVSDIVRMILALMACPAAVGGVCNIGSDQPVSILELAQRVIAAVDGDGSDRFADRQFQSYTEAYGDDFEDCRRRVPDLTKLRAVDRRSSPVRRSTTSSASWSSGSSASPLTLRSEGIRESRSYSSRVPKVTTNRHVGRCFPGSISASIGIDVASADQFARSSRRPVVRAQVINRLSSPCRLASGKSNRHARAAYLCPR